MFGSSLFPAFYGPRSQFLISAFRNASQKREALNALLVTPPAPGGKTSCSRWSTGRVRRGCSCMSCWFETVSTKPISCSAIIWLRGGGRQAAEPLPCIALSFFPAGRRRQQLPCQNCNAFWIGPLQRCSPLVCSFPTSMYESRSNATARRNPWGRSSWCRNAPPKQKRKFAKHNFFEQKKSAQTAAPAVKVEENIACVGQRPFDELSSEGLSLL